VIFNTWSFALFACVTLGFYWSVVPQRRKPAFLVAAGVLFYAASVPAYLLLVGALAGLTYALGRAMLRAGSEAQRSRLLTFGIVTIVAALAYFKYAGFLTATVNAIARYDLVPAPHVVVPLAISFFTFEFVHVLVDVRAGRIVRLDALEFAAFATFFPTLVAGPIKRYQSFAPQLRAIEAPAPQTAALDAYRILLGLAKKTVIADSMHAFTGPLLGPGDPYGRIDYWVAILAYAIEIYADFSAYSDIAIGCSGLLGLRVPENFAHPYRARNIADFWRTWHVSLSTWIRDYVFVPLGGSRGAPLVTALNLIVAMALAGLWHGAAWTFVVWGLWHGAGLAVHRAWVRGVVPRVAFLRDGSLAVRALSTASTFAFVAAGWVFFAAPSLGDALAVFRHLFA